MALNQVSLKAAAAATSIFNKLNMTMPPLLPAGTDLAQAQGGWQRIAEAVAECMPDIISEFLANAQIQVTVPSGTFLVTAQSGVLNASPVNVPGIIQA